MKINLSGKNGVTKKWVTSTVENLQDLNTLP